MFLLWNLLLIMLFRSRFRFLTFITEASKLLPFYLTKLKSSNGIVVVRKLESPSYIATDFDVVINCSGLGADHLENYQLPQAESEHRCYIIPKYSIFSLFHKNIRTNNIYSFNIVLYRELRMTKIAGTHHLIQMIPNHSWRLHFNALISEGTFIILSYHQLLLIRNNC